MERLSGERHHLDSDLVILSRFMSVLPSPLQGLKGFLGWFQGCHQEYYLLTGPLVINEPLSEIVFLSLVLFVFSRSICCSFDTFCLMLVIEFLHSFLLDGSLFLSSENVVLFFLNSFPFSSFHLPSSLPPFVRISLSFSRTFNLYINFTF